MTTSNTVKKQPLKDWHPADIVAAVRKAGWSLRKLSAVHGLSHSAIQVAMYGRSRTAEKIISDAIGIPVETIWPERCAARRQRALKKQAKEQRK